MRRQNSPPKGSAEDLLQALREAETQHQKKRRGEQRRKKLRWLEFLPGRLQGVIKWLLITAVIAFVALFIDGLRREGGELHALLAAFRGAVRVAQGAQAALVTPRANLPLAHRDVVTTGLNGDATIVFPEGSAVRLEPRTRFEVKLADYGRGGVRDRALLLRDGGMITRISRFFGSESQMSIQTPNAVAAARGTGFRVSYIPDRDQTIVEVVDGVVHVRTSGGGVVLRPGLMASAAGGEPPRVEPLPAAARARVGAVFQQLAGFERPPSFLERLERWLLALLDPLLQPLGFAPGGWNMDATDSARRVAAQEALRRLQQVFAGLPNDQVPDRLNPVNLRELPIPPLLRDGILDSMAGKTVEVYRRTGPTSFVLRARARDRNRTLYELTDNGARLIPE